MTLHLGMVKPGSTIYIPFDTFAGATGASITMTGLAVGDIMVFRNGNTTQRASTTGFTLLDTDGIDFDAITGLHGFSIDLSSNATADFYTAGAFYWVVVSTITVDAQTLSFTAATFQIGYPGAILDTTIATLATQTSFTLTAGPAEDDALNGCEVVIHDIASAVQAGRAFISDYTGSTKTVTLVAGTTFTAAAGDNISVFLSALQPTVQGRSLDVSTGGEAGLDWANVGSPTTAQNLSSTNIDVDQVVASVSGAVGSVTTVSDKTGYSLSAAGVTAARSVVSGTADSGSTTTMVDAARTEADTDYWAGDIILFTSGNIAGQARVITAFTPGTDTITFTPATTQAVSTQTYEIIPGARAILAGITHTSARIPNVTLTDTITTYTGDTPQTGDSFARLGAPAGASVSADIAAIEAQTDDIGVAGAGLTALGDARLANLDATVSSRLATASYSTPPQESVIADAVWDEVLSTHQGAGSAGAMFGGLVLEQGTIGATGNSTTTLHLAGLTYSDDEINNYLLVIYDVSEAEYHSRWIADWANTGDLATVATLPFTPQNSTDLYWLLPIRQDVTGGLDAAGVRAAVGLASANLDTQLAAIDDFLDTEVAAILADTNELQTDWADGGRLDLILDARASQASVNTIDDFLDTEIADIQARLPAALVSGRMDSSVGAMAADTITSAALAASAVTEIQTGLSTLTAAQVNAEADTALADVGLTTTITGRIDAAISTRATPAQVNAEVVDAFAVDTYAEPGQGTPAATATLAAKINYLYKAWRNKKTQTATTYSLFADDATTVDQKATISDDTVTTTVGEVATGP